MHPEPNLDHPGDTNDDALPADERPSKSARKRDMHALQALGEALVALPAARRARLVLPEALGDAVDEYLRTRSHEGRRRQMQFIGKLMRQVDPEPIARAVAEAKLGQAADSLALHEAEAWRERLLAPGDALTEWLTAHPGSDAQQLRSLIRAARKAAEAPPPPGTPPGVKLRASKTHRELFQWLRGHLNTPT